MRSAKTLVSAAVIGVSATQAQGSSPQKNVEIVVGSAPGGSNDKTDIEKNFWSDDFVTGERFRKDLDKDYADMKAVLVDLGLAKAQ
jgi:tripartite-type tricarboxylate transporter receptor subunit TctC